eukprot:365247-Chlamydomonas_euryale.AAC.3
MQRDPGARLFVRTSGGRQSRLAAAARTAQGRLLCDVGRHGWRLFVERAFVDRHGWQSPGRRPVHKTLQTHARPVISNWVVPRPEAAVQSCPAGHRLVPSQEAWKKSSHKLGYRRTVCDTPYMHTSAEGSPNVFCDSRRQTGVAHFLNTHSVSVVLKKKPYSRKAASEVPMHCSMHAPPAYTNMTVLLYLWQATGAVRVSMPVMGPLPVTVTLALLALFHTGIPVMGPLPVTLTLLCEVALTDGCPQAWQVCSRGDACLKNCNCRGQ